MQRGRHGFPREVIFHKITPFSTVALQMELYRFSMICILINFIDQVRNKFSILVRVSTRNRWAFKWSKAKSGCLMVSNNFLKFKPAFSINNCLCNILKATFQVRSRFRNFVYLQTLLITNAHWLWLIRVLMWDSSKVEGKGKAKNTDIYLS